MDIHINQQIFWALVEANKNNSAYSTIKNHEYTGPVNNAGQKTANGWKAWKALLEQFETADNVYRMSLALQRQLEELKYTGNEGYTLTFHISKFNEILHDIKSKDVNAITDYRILDIFSKSLRDRTLLTLKQFQKTNNWDLERFQKELMQYETTNSPDLGRMVSIHRNRRSERL